MALTVLCYVLALSALASQVLASTRLPSRVVTTASSKHGTIRVVDVDTRPPIRYMLTDSAALGARFRGHGLEEQTPFTNFVVLMAAAHLEPRPKRVLQLGLGVGIVPQYFDRLGIRSDVVELDRSVANLAQSHFGFNSSGTALGRLYVTDAHKFLFKVPSGKRLSATQRYDVIVHDLFSGGTSWKLLAVDVLEKIRASWLADSGTLLVNIVGCGNSQDNNHTCSAFPDVARLTHAVGATLRKLFPFVRAYREMPFDKFADRLTNIVFYASVSEPQMKLPPLTEQPVEMSPDWVLHSFLKWPIALDADAEAITETSGERLCSAGQEAVQTQMLQQLREEFPFGLFDIETKMAATWSQVIDL